MFFCCLAFLQFLVVLFVLFHGLLIGLHVVGRNTHPHIAQTIILLYIIYHLVTID